jgi:hypothetical protein
LAVQRSIVARQKDGDNQQDHRDGKGDAETRPPKRTEKLQLMLGPDELKAIDDWRFENRLPSRAAAIRELIRRGLQSADFSDPPEEAASGEFRIVDE